MPSAKASGSDANGAGASARSRDHKQGNQNTTYSDKDEEVVLRIKRCAPNAYSYYEMLAIERTATSANIKTAYRKLSLLTHPDKNGHPKAGEAFGRE
jgi:DnaJ family protein B protein 12